MAIRESRHMPNPPGSAGQKVISPAPIAPIAGGQQPPGGGQLSASSISLTASPDAVALAPIRMFSKLLEFDQYDGSGVPTFFSAAPAVYWRNDGTTATMVYVNAGNSSTWA